MIPILTIVAVGICCAALAAFAVASFVPSEQTSATEARLDLLASRRGANAGGKEPSLLLDGGLETRKEMFDSLFGSMPGLTAYIEQANVRLTATQFLMICGGAGMFGFLVPVLIPSVPILFAPISGIILAGIPAFWLRMCRAKRMALFGRQLPEALELLGRSLRAGHSLAAGFGLIASEMNEPINIEFGRVFQEQNLGIPLEEALDDMATRIPNMDVRFFATAVILQRQTGGDLAEILDKIGHLVRERLQILGQIQALTGEGRLSGIVLLAMPPLLFLVMLWMNPDYIMTLFTDSIGQKLLGFGLVTQVLGALVIRKIVTIKV